MAGGGKKKAAKREKSSKPELAEVKRIEQEKLKQQQAEDELRRQRLAVEQAEERRKMEIVENNLRRTQLQESSEYFADFNAKIRGILQSSKRHQDWQRYMRCNGLPDVSQPGDLRKYIHMWREGEEQLSRNERNWLLQTNEETVLTQDRNVPNLTVAHVRSCQKNMGIVYAERIREVLHILGELQMTLDDPAGLSDFIVEDLISIRTELRVNLSAYIDQMAFKILSNIDRDMTLDAVSSMATYYFQSDILSTQLFTVRDIPQPQLTAKERLKEEAKHLEMEFSLLKLHVNLPPTIKLCKSALRAIWLNFDHFSDYCPSYQMPQLPPHCRYPRTLGECCAEEWRMRQEIKEIETANLHQQQERQPGGGNSGAQIDPGASYVDVDRMYAEYEEAQMALRRRLRGPEMLKLRPTEINLRSHRIVGGIYGIDYLEQPKQNVKIGRVFLTTIHQRHLAKRLFYQSYKPPSPPQPGVRRLPEEIEAEIKQMEQNLDKLVLVNVQLPESVIWFEPPLVCRWEYPEETEMHFDEDQETLAATATKDGAEPAAVASGPEATECTCHRIRRRRSRNRGMPGTQSPTDAAIADSGQLKRIQDFNLLNIPTTVDMYEVMAHYIMPRLPDGYRIKTDAINPQHQQRRSSLMKYAMPELKRRSQKRDSNVVTELLEPTGSPRNLFPIMSYKKAFQVEVCEEMANDKRCVQGGRGDSRKGHDDGDVKKGRTEERKDVYMLSRFLKDLDKLKLAQCPKFQKTLHDSLILNSPKKGTSGGLSVAVDDAASAEPSNEAVGWTNALKIIEGESVDADEGNREGVWSRNSFAEEEKCPFCVAEEAAGKSYANMGHWSSRDVHDVKFNEDKFTIQFRTGRLGFFGFAANRYSNLPFQTWELKPDVKNLNLITFTLTAAVVSVDISISEDGVRLNTIQGCSTAPFQALIGQFMEFKTLKETLLRSAVDLFPEEGSDATIYTEGSCEKHNVMERHLYECMASVAMSHNFSWSRWNLLAGSRIAVLLMREFVDNRKPLNHSTLYVTPLRTTVIDCTEVSASFNTTPAAGMEYHADLHHLVLKHGHPSSVQKKMEMSLALRKNVAQILKSTRPLSFC